MHDSNYMVYMAHLSSANETPKILGQFIQTSIIYTGLLICHSICQSSFVCFEDHAQVTQQMRLHDIYERFHGC